MEKNDWHGPGEQRRARHRRTQKVIDSAAGLAALPFLQFHGLAACTVRHDSARIGEANSTLADGIVSHVNPLAQALGVKAGQHCRQVIQTLQALA